MCPTSVKKLRQLVDLVARKVLCDTFGIVFEGGVLYRYPIHHISHPVSGILVFVQRNLYPNHYLLALSSTACSITGHAGGCAIQVLVTQP